MIQHKESILIKDTGVILYKLDILNLWSYQHALLLTPFLYIRKMMRKKSEYLKIKLLYWGGIFYTYAFYSALWN